MNEKNPEVDSHAADKMSNRSILFYPGTELSDGVMMFFN